MASAEWLEDQSGLLLALLVHTDVSGWDEGLKCIVRGRSMRN